MHYSVTEESGNIPIDILIIDVVAVRDTENNTELFPTSYPTAYVLPMNMTNKPIEFRFYIITEEPGSHTLNHKKS